MHAPRIKKPSGSPKPMYIKYENKGQQMAADLPSDANSTGNCVLDGFPAIKVFRENDVLLAYSEACLTLIPKKVVLSNFAQKFSNCRISVHNYGGRVIIQLSPRDADLAERVHAHVPKVFSVPAESIGDLRAFTEQEVAESDANFLDFDQDVALFFRKLDHEGYELVFGLNGFKLDPFNLRDICANALSEVYITESGKRVVSKNGSFYSHWTKSHESLTLQITKISVYGMSQIVRGFCEVLWRHLCEGFFLVSVDPAIMGQVCLLHWPLVVGKSDFFYAYRDSNAEKNRKQLIEWGKVKPFEYDIWIDLKGLRVDTAEFDLYQDLQNLVYSLKNDLQVKFARKLGMFVRKVDDYVVVRSVGGEVAKQMCLIFVHDFLENYEIQNNFYLNHDKVFSFKDNPYTGYEWESEKSVLCAVDTSKTNFCIILAKTGLLLDEREVTKYANQFARKVNLCEQGKPVNAQGRTFGLFVKNDMKFNTLIFIFKDASAYIKSEFLRLLAIELLHLVKPGWKLYDDALRNVYQNFVLAAERERPITFPAHIHMQ